MRYHRSKGGKGRCMNFLMGEPTFFYTLKEGGAAKRLMGREIKERGVTDQAGSVIPVYIPHLCYSQFSSPGL